MYHTTTRHAVVDRDVPKAEDPSGPKDITIQYSIIERDASPEVYPYRLKPPIEAVSSTAAMAYSSIRASHARALAHDTDAASIRGRRLAWRH